MPLEYWPYIICLIVFILGGFFAQSRLALLALLLAVFTLLLGWFGLHRLNQPRLDAAVLAAALYIPALTVLFYFLRERGLWSAFGAIRTVGVMLAFFVFFVFSEFVTLGDSPSVRQSMWLNRVADWLPLPFLGLLSLGGALGALQVRRTAESPLLGSFLSVMLLIVFVGLSFRAFAADQRELAALILYSAMTVASVVLAAAVLEGSWRHAYIDELTDLPSRRSLKHHCARLGADFVMAVIDIDHFKAINDRYGHATGDQVLRFIASVIKKNAIGRAYRQGGEEFVIVAENIALKSAGEALENLRRTIATRPFGIRDPHNRPRRIARDKPRPARPSPAETINVTISIGIAASGAGHGAPEEVLAVADRALYRAKDEGRNRVHIAR